MKITYPNHSESVLVRASRGISWLLERAITVMGWAIVVLTAVFVIALLIRVAWSFVVLALKAIGEL
ncbi:MAG: hypothetical protein ACYSWQ_04305 [Planctomycetota bacterium]|jgi:hypothetical protein